MSPIGRNATLSEEVPDSELDPRGDVDEWLANLGGRYALAVIGPDPFGKESDRLVALHAPYKCLAAAEAIARSDDFGIRWRQDGGPPASWESLDRQQSKSPWRQAWYEMGFLSLVRVEMQLPAQRAFECFLFSERELASTSEAASLGWNLMGFWPTLRAQIQVLHSPLNSREQKCLALGFEGLTAQETAERLNISKRQVDFIYEQVMKKLKAPNKAAAIQRACWLGAI